MSGTAVERVDASFAAHGSSAGEARRFVRRALRDWALDAFVDDALLLVSELVTNAVVHAGTVTEVTCTRLGDAARPGVRIEVTDRYPGRWLPMAPAVASDDAEGGRGLALAAALAAGWGVGYTPVSKRVWFVLGEDAARAGDAAPPGRAAEAALDPAGVVVPSVPGVPAPPVAPAGADREDLGLPEAAGLVLTVDELLAHVVERACELLGGDAGFAVVTSEDDDEVQLRARTGLAGGRLPGREDQRSPLAWSEPRCYGSADDQGPAADLLRQSELGSAVTVPLLAADRLVGAVGVAAGEPARFGPAELARLERAVAPAAAAVQVAKVLELERGRRGRLSFLAEASELLAGTPDRELMLALLGRLVVPRLVPWCAVHEADAAGAARLAYAWHADEERVDDLRERLAAVPPPAIGDRAHLWRPDGDPSLRATVLPLSGRGGAVGALLLGTPDRRLRRDVLELAEDLARRAGLALDNARLHAERTATAQAFQRSLLPPGLPAVPGADLGVAYAAAGAGDEVGGDFYDVFRLGAGRWGFAVGDVCGRGPEAAAVAGLARHTLRLLGQEGRPLPAVLQRLNTAILAEGPRSRFLTLVCGSLLPVAPAAGPAVDVSLVCAGHPLPLLLRPDGTVRPVGTPQPLLGVLPDVAYEPETVRLTPGDALVCVTDGVTGRRGEAGVFGEEGLVALLRRSAGRTAPEIAEDVRRTVVGFGREPARDDLAVLVVHAG